MRGAALYCETKTRSRPDLTKSGDTPRWPPGMAHGHQRKCLRSWGILGAPGGASEPGNPEMGGTLRSLRGRLKRKATSCCSHSVTVTVHSVTVTVTVSQARRHDQNGRTPGPGRELPGELWATRNDRSGAWTSRSARSGVCGMPRTFGEAKFGIDAIPDLKKFRLLRRFKSRSIPWPARRKGSSRRALATRNNRSAAGI